MTPTIAYMDCESGLCGDTLLAALVHAGLTLDTLNTMLASFPVSEGRFIVEPVATPGRSGYRLRIIYPPSTQPSYTLAQAITFLNASSLAVRVQTTVHRMLQYVFEAEATVQGIQSDVLQLPSTYVMEALLYGAGVVVGLDALQVFQLYASPFPLLADETVSFSVGCGSSSRVVLEIFQRTGVPVKPRLDNKVPVTPVAAAIIGTLARFDAPVMTIERAGYGFSATDTQNSYSHGIYIGRAYILSSVTGGEAETDWIAYLESHIDNMSGELLGGLMERLFAAGALDVSYTPIQMKKNRPATKVTVICPPEEGERLSLLLLRETSTLGVRIQHIQRLKAQRFQQQIETPLGPVLVKVKRLGDHILSVAPEYEECQRIAIEQQLPLSDVYELARRAAERLIIMEEEGMAKRSEDKSR